jgi:hypothetical protein
VTARRAVGLAVAAAVGGTAALSWCLWIWLALGSAPAGRDPCAQGPGRACTAEIGRDAGREQE